jgi:hypothetical protein
MSRYDEQRSFDEVIGEYLPIDGPHSADTVLDAAGGVAELVRYVNHATLWDTKRLNGPQLYRTLGRLSSAAHGLAQLLGQLQAIAHQLATDPTLYDDRRDRPASRTATGVAELLGKASTAVAELTAPLDSAHALSSHLGHDQQPRRPRQGRSR